MPKPVDQNAIVAAAMATAEERIVWLVTVWVAAAGAYREMADYAAEGDAMLEQYRARFKPIKPDGSF